ncbi:hypothetical protein K6V92_20925 [Cupriavidus respiraculi]|uniref:hypothetical protein n=1 Tax=Cupriavidus respiraculi TaxID=195930 RepID=UPI001C945B90|nr:hypothetical protein [Cupriavidus respiraculi]MBY4949069.1 hypothetical protein [Cupriavidus respiraculi]
MTESGLGIRGRLRSLSVLVSVASAMLLVSAVSYDLAMRPAGWTAAGSQSPLKLSGALGLYFLSHVLRFGRLSVLVGAGRLRRFLSLYVFVAACSSVIPFKLGELSRINELAWWTGSYWRGLLVVWVERTFDVIALAMIVLFLALQPLGAFPAIWPLLFLMAMFAAVSVLVFFILPEQLVSLNLHVMRNYSGMKAVRILAILDRGSELLLQFRPMISGKLVTVAVLTILIWGLELSAVALLFDDGVLTKGALALVTQFSDEFSLRAAGESATLAHFNAWRTAGIGVSGLIGLCFYIEWRRRSAR